MKTLFIESRLKNIKLILSKQEIAKLPKKLILCYTIQYKLIAESIKKQLELNKIKILSFKQVLGCSNLNNKPNFPISKNLLDFLGQEKILFPVLYIGTGKFHAINLYLQASELYILDIVNNHISKVPVQDIEKIKAKKRASLLKFLNAEKIGILVSTKPGQENIKKAIELKKKLKNKGKQVFVFISNNIDTSQFENFNIDSWINTACLGLSNDNPNIINYTEIPNL